MKILCVSDQIDPLVYTNSIKERFADIDLVLSAGDLPMDYLEFIVSSLNKPVLFVFGNHNLKELRYYRKTFDDHISSAWDTQDLNPKGSGAVHIGSRIIREGDLIIAGLGGSLVYNHGENQFTNFQMNLEILKLIPKMLYYRITKGRFLDILLTHASPEGIHDRPDPCHRGFKAFLWFMRVFKPKYLLHGHIHLYDLSDLRTSQYHETTIINVYSHYLIDTEDKK
ncbi:metallophosphoesterase [Breznakiella homolactica]|uniref:Metallophosphoesterase n=1 Tax=Breznakiella homolactica TaxID=2798577 RepID=A0A7T8BA37_9SPIR|nr:metallophosphoesterase [Breznakiella homolactica]QQO08585.1 metallophosphoesterase [Breznakiella homolactica]